MSKKLWVYLTWCLSAAPIAANCTESIYAKLLTDSFYNAVKKHNCDEAGILHTITAVNSCTSLRGVKNFHINGDVSILDNEYKQIAIVPVSVSIEKNGKWESFKGCVTLKKQGSSNWIIIKNSYVPTNNEQECQSNAKVIKKSNDNYVGDQLPTEKQILIQLNKKTQPTNELPIPNYTADPNINLPDSQNLNIPLTQTRSSTNGILSCWSNAELRDGSSEKIAYKQTPNHNPPERIKPNHQAKPLGENWAKSIRSVKLPPNEKLVAFAFDLCEKSDQVAGYDADLVNWLRDNQVKATFFAGGYWMQTHETRAMQLIADPLFEIGNHTWTHGNLRVIHGQQLKEQIEWTQAEYELLRDQLSQMSCAQQFPKELQAIPLLPTTLRFPYGACDTESLQAAANLGLYSVQWSIVTGDPSRQQTAAAIVKRILNQIHPGAIIVAHANSRGWHTAEAMQIVIPKLRKLGYTLVTVSELLKRGTPVTAESCYEAKPGDNLKYDRILGKGTE